ncbi:PASTA domain-containing protein [Arthrobacter sp. H5]|uniref:Stk1 family PASTA domain-containing Ser/Thr kinase n=1 Tax=Arthrobacter sp. H5 TaxID=1267973 RepID=UPI000488AC87|nr:PASTA domain-containing protein [Arthrobacter sp. H5]
MQERLKDTLVGSVVDGRYRVQSRLARGGMSTVYLATDQRLDRDVALKVLYPHLADDDGFLERFEREAKSAARLSHPHVVGVLDQGMDYGPDHNTAYLVMEYVPGRTLRELLREKGRLTPRLALAMMDPVIEGLGAAHEAGLVHRDVKPENVLLSDNGRIKIADFGLARAVSTSTNTGTLVGTVAYLSPELVTSGVADARSDIYSAGIMLFELLTGRQPYTGDVPIQVAFQHANSTVPPPSSLIGGLAADIDELVQWCTSLDPESRPIDGNALLGELRHIRTTLTDEQLDFVPIGPAGGPGAAPSGAPGATGVIGRLDSGGRTEVIGTGPRPTEVISAAGNPTTVFRNARNDTTVLGATPMAGSVEKRQLSAKARDKDARKEFKSYQKQQARAAQRPEKSLHGGNAGRQNAIWITLLILLGLLAAGAGWFFGVGPGALVSVPDVTSRPVAAAQALLTQQGLSSTEESIHHESVEEGLVIGSEPAASSDIRRYERVRLFVSLGPELFGVPNTVGQTEAAAAGSLVEQGLAVGDITREFSDSVANGQVINQDPAAGQEVPRGTGVTLVVSQGPEPIDVPSVLGLPRDEAVAALEATGLVPEIAAVGENDADVPVDAVLTQIPSDGQLTRGETVSLTLSLGPRIIAVPDVFSDTEADAVAKLEAAGFAVEVNYAFGQSLLGLVAGQSPTGEQPEGTTITITVT